MKNKHKTVLLDITPRMIIVIVVITVLFLPITEISKNPMGTKESSLFNHLKKLNNLVVD